MKTTSHFIHPYFFSMKKEMNDNNFILVLSFFKFFYLTGELAEDQYSVYIALGAVVWKVGFNLKLFTRQ